MDRLPERRSSDNRRAKGVFEVKQIDKAMAWRPAYDLARDITSTVFGLELGHELDAHIARKDIATRDAIRRANSKLSKYQRVSCRIPSRRKNGRLQFRDERPTAHAPIHSRFVAFLLDQGRSEILKPDPSQLSISPPNGKSYLV